MRVLVLSHQHGLPHVQVLPESGNVFRADALIVEEGSLYPALYRLEQRGWIKSEWGTSENNRRARFYGITRAGRKQLQSETDSWTRTVAMINRLLEGQP
jgi:transcriptional regulator